MSKYSVRGNPAPGHAYSFRAGRAWGKDPIVVEIVDGEEDATPIPGLRMGQRSFRALTEDGRVSVVPAPESSPIVEPPVGRDKYPADMKADLDVMRREMTEMRRQLVRATTPAAPDAALAAENAGLKAQLEALKAQAQQPPAKK